MSILKPPSAFSIPNVDKSPSYPDFKFKLPAIQSHASSKTTVSTQSTPQDTTKVRDTAETQATVEQLTSETQTCHSFVNRTITELEDYILKIISKDQKISKPCDTDSEFEGVWEALSKLESSFYEKTDTIEKLSTAVHRTIPESLEQQRVVQSLEDDKQGLEKEIEEMAETMALLEKRMECQSKVLAIQEKTLTTDGSYQKMLEAWRHKVLEMLVEKEMGNVADFRTEMALKSQVEKLEKTCRKNEVEVEILSNKNSDLLANLKLKDKHISTITNELSLAKQSEIKYEQMNELIKKANNSLCENISSMGENFEQFIPNHNSIAEKLAIYEVQIDRISESVVILQSLYAEKEEFYSNKLESLLTEHTKPLQPVAKSTSQSQTESSWHEIEGNTSLLNDRISEHSTKINSLTVDKGLITSQLAEAEAARCDLKHQLTNLREQLSTKCSEHEEEVVHLQKRESKAAIRAKHVERQLARKEEDIATLEREFSERWKVEVDQIQGQVQVLKNENSSLKQALKRG